MNQVKTQIIAFCSKKEMLVEESILKIKIPKSGLSEDQVIAGVQSALFELGSNMDFRITNGKSFYRVVDKFTRDWIIDNSIDELVNYSDGEITIRGLHYRLVARGMTNSMTHYSRVKSAMVYARRNGTISYSQFSDHDRETIGITESDQTDVDSAFESSSDSIEYYLKYYWKNRWENQLYYPEVWIEKKALIGVFEKLCRRNNISLNPCKGYPSLTFLRDAADRFEQAEKNDKKPIILYFGDYDASGEDIPRSIKQNLYADFGVDVEVRRVLLMEDQVVEMNLPPAPTKAGDSRGNTWTGLGQVELDSVDPKTIQKFCQDAIDEIFDIHLYNELMELQKTERQEYQAKIKEFVENYEFE